MRFLLPILILCGCSTVPPVAKPTPPPLPPLPVKAAAKASALKSPTAPTLGTLSWDFAYDAGNTPSNIVFLVFTKPDLSMPWTLLATTSNLNVQFTAASQGFFKAQTSNIITGMSSP